LTKDINLGRLFHGATGSTNADVTLTINDIRLRIPKITPSIHIEPMLLKQISSDKIAKAITLDRHINSITIDQATVRYNWEISRLMNNPRYLFVVFQDTTAADDILQNNSKFVSYKDGTNYIKNLQLHVDNVRYPVEPIIVHDGTERNKYDAYDLYVKMCNNFGNICPMDIDDFNDLACIFCFDLSASEELLKKNGINVKLIIEKTLFPCRVYALYLEDNIYSLNYKTGMITSEL